MVSDSYRVHVSGSRGTAKARRFVLLDRDGTIIVERKYLSDPEQVELIPGAAEALRRLRQIGWDSRWLRISPESVGDILTPIGLSWFMRK